MATFVLCGEQVDLFTPIWIPFSTLKLVLNISWKLVKQPSWSLVLHLPEAVLAKSQSKAVLATGVVAGWAWPRQVKWSSVRGHHRFRKKEVWEPTGSQLVTFLNRFQSIFLKQTVILVSNPFAANGLVELQQKGAVVDHLGSSGTR